MIELWLPIPDWEDFYQVSDWGRIKSLARTRVDNGAIKHYPERILKQGFNGRAVVCLAAEGRRRSAAVSVLVLETFVGPRPSGAIARHFPDPDPFNNILTNLSWSTQSQNMLDRRVHGTDAMVNKTTCPTGHPYTFENTKRKKNGARLCRECANSAQASYYQAKRIIT